MLLKMLADLNTVIPLVIVNMLGFGALFLLARKMVFAPIGVVLDERERDIVTGYDKLDRSQREMEALKSEYEGRLARAEAEAREQRETAVKEAQAIADRLKADAATSARETIARAQSEANREKEQAMIELKQQIVDLALGATTRLIGEGLDTNRQRALIDSYIATGIAPAATPTTSGKPAEA